MVEQEAVNFEVVGSSPTRGANSKKAYVGPFFSYSKLFFLLIYTLFVSGCIFINNVFCDSTQSAVYSNHIASICTTY